MLDEELGSCVTIYRFRLLNFVNFLLQILHWCAAMLSKKAVSLKTIFLEKRIQSFSKFFSYGHLIAFVTVTALYI